MALARIGDRVLFFAHIPKTGGGSIANYLSQKGPVALHHPYTLGWSVTTPQHMPAAVHEVYVPEAFYDLSFAVMRHPLDRMLSEYRYRIGRNETALPFGRWARTMMRRVEKSPDAWDNHLRPQADFLLSGMIVFRFEAGLAPVQDWIDSVTGTPSADRGVWKNRAPALDVRVTDRMRGQIEAFYARDLAIIEGMGGGNGVPLGALPEMAERT